MDGISLILGWLALGSIAALIGSRKAEGALSFIVSLILGPLGIVPALLSKSNRRQCPQCKRYLRSQTTTCSYCDHRALPEDNPLGAHRRVTPLTASNSGTVSRPA